MTHLNCIRGTRYTKYEVYEVYEVYESSADAAWKAAALCLGTVLVVGYKKASTILSLNKGKRPQA